jgi:hypothetical protein
MATTTQFTSQKINFVAPDWFRQRWEKGVSFGEAISSRYGGKSWSEFEQDLQRAMKDSWTVGSSPRVILMYLHECGNVTRADVTIEEIRYSEPDAWHEVSSVPAHEAWDRCVERPWPTKTRGSKNASDAK